MNKNTLIIATLSGVVSCVAFADNQGTSLHSTRSSDISPIYQVAPLESENSFYDTYIKGRLHLGLSYTKMSMDKTSTPHERSFLGNLDRLDEDDTDSIGLTIKYDVCDYFAVMFADDMNAKLSAWNYSNQSSDGALKLDGFTIQAIAQYPIEIPEQEVKITPYVGIGLSSFSAKWSHANWWHYGWPNPEAYDQLANGSTEPRNGYSRWMLPKDPSEALTLSVGVEFQIYEHFDIDLFYRYVDLDDVKADFRTYSPDGHFVTDGAFPAKFSAFGIALRYVF